MSSAQNNQSDIPFWLVIPAAGIGQRTGNDLPKQYQMLAGKTVLEHTLNAFLPLTGLQGIIIALHPDDQHFAGLALNDKRIDTVTGGKERADSVLNALHSLTDRITPDSWVLVHDAARPCVKTGEVASMLQALDGEEVGGIMAVPASDTIKRVAENGEILGTEVRDSLWHAQTPQMFRHGLLRESLQRALDENVAVTDEASALESQGYQPKVFQGKRSNIKITLPEDFAIATEILDKLR